MQCFVSIENTYNAIIIVYAIPKERVIIKDVTDSYKFFEISMFVMKFI